MKKRNIVKIMLKYMLFFILIVVIFAVTVQCITQWLGNFQVSTPVLVILCLIFSVLLKMNINNYFEAKYNHETRTRAVKTVTKELDMLLRQIKR
jgi:branched-subunit amino acid permease